MEPPEPCGEGGGGKWVLGYEGGERRVGVCVGGGVGGVAEMCVPLSPAAEP